MDDALLAKILIMGFLLFTGSLNWGTKITFPWRIKDFRRFSLIHLRRTGELTVTPQVETKDASRSLRGVYLAIIKRWHPDKATSTEDFFRRNHITALANKAYDENDSASLDELHALKKGT